MIIHSIRFTGSSADLAHLPPPDKPEYAFTGRSNVGKSSLINMLTGRKKLARISSTPGKTRIINHYLVNEQWYLVDLPGYGYAKTSKTNRTEWNMLLKQYLLKRPNLLSVFVLIDSRIPPQKNDLDFLEFLGMNQIPFCLVFTKTDKLSSQKLKIAIQEYKKGLLLVWETLPPWFVTSSVTRTGREEILGFIDETNRFDHQNG
ncbi:MAG TPA: YihA family ribosome biogenesis GTP-binding protein [Bacteroidetes bacterium]|nr:YihA family ribosome biogenesis GTP-binding protein [Bacteroidota bacterium]